VSSVYGLVTTAEFKCVEEVVRHGYFYDPVKTVTTGSAEVMDIEVDDPNHSFVGNGIVNHNTLQLLSALCYQWEKEPDNKAIVVTPKSALRQWAGEVEKFTVGIDTYVVSGKPEERKAMYEKWAAAPTGPNARKAILLVNYAILVRDWDVGGERPLLPNGQPDPKKPVSPGLLDRITANISRLVVTYDECFDYHTPILLADGSTELIGRIVSKRLPVSVLSMNWKTGSIEEKRVVNWFRKPLTHSRRESLLKIGFRFAGVVNVTPSHVFYNTRGESFRANTLKPGKKTAMFVEDIPSDDQLQVILGSLLGDASLSHPQRVCWGICMGHSIKQASYLEFKRDLLKPLGVSDISFYQTELQSGEQRMCRFRLNGNIALTSRLASWGVHDGVKRKLSVSLLDQIGPLGLAIWYSDDGSLDTKTLTDGTVRRTITLHTEGFSHEENELLAGWLRWRWDVEARVLRTKSRKEGHYSVIYLPAEAAERFLALLPGALPGVEYKWPAGTPVLGVKSFKTEPLRGIVEDQVVSVEPWLPRSTNKRFVYDIEVDGNHNYFANGTLVSNCTAFKNTGTKTWQVCRQLSDRAKRCYGLTATLLKNNLMEGFSIYKVIQPTIFATKTKFMDEFCVVKLQPVGGGRKVPVVVGYRNLDHFRRIIDPFFLGRQKHMVSSELPKLITRQIVCEMSPSEDTKYAEALSGVLELGDGETKEYQETAALTSLIYCQQVVDSLHLLRFEEGQEIAVGLFKDESVKVKDKGAKEEALVDLITGELDDEKVIVYTRFEKLVGRLQSVLTAAGVKSVRITGKENDVKRREAQQAFQDLKSDTKIIFITDAGSEAINLQAASAIVFYDAPWSWGTYVQLLGRPIRIGSIHDTVVAYHIVAKRPKGKYKSDKTIDDHVLQLLGSKKNLVDKVLGEAAVGALSFNKDEAGGNATRELLRMMKENK
jgi:hypothetical protein